MHLALVLELTTKALTLAGELFDQVKPGLSAYANRPSQAAYSLRSLLDKALAFLPSGQCQKTPLILRATAGLRLLPRDASDRILEEVSTMLSSTCFLVTPNSVSILDGLDEGLYLWTTLNFLLNRLPSPASDASPSSASTVGCLDLGGGSTQITFQPRLESTLVNLPSNSLFLRSLPGDRQIYTHSYLGLGLMAARFSVLHEVTKRLTPLLPSLPVDNHLYSPCIPVGAKLPWSYAGRDWIVQSSNNAGGFNASSSLLLSYELTKAFESLNAQSISPSSSPSPPSTSTLCYAFAQRLLRSPIEASPTSPIYPPHGYVVHRPDELNHPSTEFYAFSYIYDVAAQLGMIDEARGATSVSVGQFRDQTAKVCDNLTKETEFDCLDLAFLTALLHDGYGFAWDKKLILRKKIQSTEISWSLGALFAELKV